jgi:hypothetical protein
MTSPTIPNQSSSFATNCVRHQFESAIDRCRKCDEPFCGECLLYAFGAAQPPFCLNCALAASGVRVKGARPTRVSRREVRRREKEAREAARQAALPPPPYPADWPEPVTEEQIAPAAVPGDPHDTWLGHDDLGSRSGSIVTF